MVPNQRFNEFLADIEPSPTTVTNASSAHTQVRDHLRTHITFRNRWEGDFLAGSYARATSIRPRVTPDGHERPDIDIIVETNFETSADPDDVLFELRDALAEAFEIERVNKRSVRVLLPNAEIDVVPVVAVSSFYELPDRDLGRWKPTNPPGHKTWSEKENQRFGGRFKPLVKLFKGWRRENKTGKRPKGFVLEVLISRHAPVGQTHYGEAFAQMLQNIYAAYGALADANIKPTIEDPALSGNDILSKVSLTDWKKFLERVRVHAGYARRAQDTSDMAEATRLWRILFGPRFKETASAATASALGSVLKAPAVGAGYSFPDEDATPKKPRGFA